MATPITGVRIRLAISATLAIIGAAAGLGPFLAIWWLAGKALAGPVTAAQVLQATLAAITALAAKSLLLSASTTISHSAAFTLLFRLRNEMVDGIAVLPRAVADRRGTPICAVS
ncbi:hypothetical protein [Paracoccus sp. pheM1]|uniref:hypothetical protein n=1 Tax=Paracoccus sp. pheM1 TaxID=2831675 RepID=UPI001BDB745A|nr:hypothetical protein [Paracoccus sp. pheM1]MBT0781106.1 hypothetical protein [Paracoccus sp. pheM1]